MSTHNEQFKEDDLKLIEAAEAAAEGEATQAAGDATQQADQQGQQQTETATAAAPAAAPAPVAEAAASPAPGPAPAAPAAPATPAAPTAAPAPSPRGDNRAALRAARHGEREAKRRAEALEQELAQYRAGKAPPPAALTDEELIALEQEQPTVAKVVRQNQELAKEVEQLKTATAPKPDFTPPDFSETPEVQDAIDQVPDLVAWQYDPNAQALFARAVEKDQALQADPAWRDKPMADRFAEVARLVKEEVTPPAPAPAPTPRQDPEKVIAAAPVKQPEQISDFRGGAPTNTPTRDLSRLSDAEIMAALD